MELSIHTFLCGLYTAKNKLLKNSFALAFIEAKLAIRRFYRHFVGIYWY